MGALWIKKEQLNSYRTKGTAISPLPFTTDTSQLLKKRKKERKNHPMTLEQKPSNTKSREIQAVYQAITAIDLASRCIKITTRNVQLNKNSGPLNIYL